LRFRIQDAEIGKINQKKKVYFEELKDLFIKVDEQTPKVKQNIQDDLKVYFDF